jgi:GNAT superfamily N-acetyltransferase
MITISQKSDEIDFTVRNITGFDVEPCYALSQKMGWSHRRDDWQLMLEIGHGVAAIAGEEIIATAMWWPYDEHCATLGMIMVDSALQGRGIGRRLMDAILTQTQGRALVLNATPAGEPLYEKVGFDRCGVVQQYQGKASSVPEPVLAATERLLEGSNVRLETLAALDHGALKGPSP